MKVKHNNGGKVGVLSLLVAIMMGASIGAGFAFPAVATAQGVRLDAQVGDVIAAKAEAAFGDRYVDTWWADDQTRLIVGVLDPSEADRALAVQWKSIAPVEVWACPVGRAELNATVMEAFENGGPGVISAGPDYKVGRVVVTALWGYEESVAATLKALGMLVVMSSDTPPESVPGRVVIIVEGGNPVVAVPGQVCARFTDVPVSSVFYSSICWAAQEGLTTGSNAAGTLFSPQSPVTRGSAAAFLYRLAGSPKVTLPSVSPFADVKTTDQFYTSIVWLFQQKITVGSRCGSSLCYLPGSALNRGAMSAMLMRMSGVAGWSAPVQSSFADVQTTDQFYRSITWMASTGVTVGSTVNATLVFQQANPVTRGSMAAFLSRTSTRQLMCTAYPKSIGC